MEQKKIRGRFAPTPSGRLHLGNVFCCLLAWLYARSQGGSIVLRIEDLDAQRCPRANAVLLADDLTWLGLTWDCGAWRGEDDAAYFQSQRAQVYASFFSKLERLGLIYPCFCSRNELHAAEAPHFSDGRVVYSGRCRSLTAQERALAMQKRLPAWRVQVPDDDLTFVDGHYGWQKYNLARDNGDFIVRRSDGVFAYQLAVTVDDALMGITQVVRGRDLLPSTPLQLYLYRLLGLKPPQFCHIPLLLGPDGQRLAKRDRALDLGVLRRSAAPAQIIGCLAYLAGQLDEPRPITPEALLPIFDPDKIPLHDITVPLQLPLWQR